MSAAKASDAPLPVVVVLDDWEGKWRTSPELARLEGSADVRVFGESLTREELLAAAREARVLVLNRERTAIDADLLAALPDLRAIANTGAGLNHVDRVAAAARGVRILTTGGRSRAVVEQTFALMLAAVKRVPEFDAEIRAGGFAPRPLVGDLYGKRLGLAGLGTIGTQVAAIARAFGMRVSAWSPHLTAEKAAELNLDRAEDLTALAAPSDVFSVHLRLLPETRGIISAAVIDALPRGAVFVNTARAELVDRAALLARAERGELRVGLDVFEDEPTIDPRYRRLTGALSPHVGWKSEGTWDEFVRLGVERIREALATP